MSDDTQSNATESGATESEGTALYRAILANAMQADAVLGLPFSATEADAPARLDELIAANPQESGAVVRLERASGDGWEATGVEVHAED